MQKYIVDFFNIFSDFREIKYKKQQINFHSVKHVNKAEDTKDFFDLFFTKYIKHANIPKTSKFIFVMKQLNDYNNILKDILLMYKTFNVTFVIIKNQYSHHLKDKNKDDFLCQYFFHLFKDSVLVTNDRYSDKTKYLHLFTNDIVATVLQYKNKSVLVSTIIYKIDNDINNQILYQTCSYTRCSIPKKHLSRIL